MDPIYLACVRVSEVKPREQIPAGVTRSKCVLCGQALYIGESGARMATAGQVQPACRPCVAKTLEGSIVVVALPNGGQEELRRYAKERAEQN